jgi:hypothetical protein
MKSQSQHQRTFDRLLPLRHFVLAAIALLIICASAMAQEKSAAEKITFDDHVKPIFNQRCSSCHNGQKREGDLDVTNYTNLMQGGSSGSVIESQDAGGSYLYQLITHEESPEMPPSGTKIPAGEIQLIASWIDMGALENKGSKAAKAKPKLDMGISESPTKKPEVVPMPLRMPLEPVIKTPRPSVTAIATSPWAPLTAVASPRQILLYNTQTLQLVGVIPLGEDVAHSLKFSRSGQVLIAGGGKDGAAGKAILFNVITGEKITSVGEELDAILSADINPSQEYVAYGGPNKLVKLMFTDGEVIAEIKKHTDWVTAVEFSPDGKYLATGDRNGGLFVWEADSGNEVFTLKGHSKAITGISWRIDGRFLATTSEDATVRLWDSNNGKQIKSWGAHGGGTTSVEFQRDGNIVTCGRDKVAKVWDQNGKMIRQYAGLTDVATAISYCDESKRLVAADWTGVLRIWNGADGKHVGNLAANPPTLAERLAWCEQGMTKAIQKHTPIAQQTAQTKAKVDAVGKSLDGAKQAQVQAQAKLTATQSQFNASKKQFESTNAQHAQWRKEFEEKKKAQPLVKESFEKATAASQALPADVELKKSAAGLQAKLNQITARVNELKGLVDKSNQEKNTTKTQMDQLAKTVKVAQSEMTNLSAQVKKLEGEHAAVSNQLKTQTEAELTSQGKVNWWTGQATRWKSDIAFIAQLKSLKEQLAAKQTVIAEKQTVVDSSQQKLLEAQKVVEQAVASRKAIEDQAAGINQQIQKLRGQK